MRGSFAICAGAALAMFAACSSFEDAADEPSAPDSGTNDAPEDRSSQSDGSPSDGAVITDGGSDSEAAAPAGMVLVQTAATSFWIDAREVTTGEFLAFKEKVVQQNGGDAGLPAVCSFKSELGPAISCNGLLPSTPVGCVDWCDAFAYCQFAGKRLCGRIGGGAPLTALEAKDRIASEWMRACTGPNPANVWPYGAEPDAAACNTQERSSNQAFDAGSLPGCVGGEPGLFDMSGNVSELIDSCEGTLGSSDTCHAKGGSFADPLYSSRCGDQETFNRGTSAIRIGFRCCKDP